MTDIHILLVEDNEGDIVLTMEALEEAKIFNNVSVVRDGQQAIEFLEKKDKFVDSNDPDLILLDINLPKKNGHEVLKYAKNDQRFQHIPIIMLTTSSSEKDINSSYRNHANCFIVKPVDADNFLKVVRDIESFWVSIVKLPNNA